MRVRVIAVPKPLELIVRVVEGEKIKEETTFYSWLDDVCEEIVKGFRTGGKGVRRQMAVAEIIEDARLTDDPTIVLDESDWELIRDAVAENDWNRWNARTILPFIEAVEEAKPEKRKIAGKAKPEDAATSATDGKEDE